MPVNLKDHPNASVSLTIDVEQELANIDGKLKNIAKDLIPTIASESAEIIYKTLKKSYFSIRNIMVAS